MNTGTWAGGAKRRVVSLLGVCMLCVCTQIGTSNAIGQVEGPGDPAPAGRTGLLVTTEPGDEGTPPVYRLALTGDPATAGPTGAFYRTTRPISHTRVIEVDPPVERVIPEGSNPLTQLVLWNERAEDGKLWPHRAIRHGGSHPNDLGDGSEPLGNWNDDNQDGLTDLGFVSIGPVDYQLMLLYGHFNPQPVTGFAADGRPTEPDAEPWNLIEPPVPHALSADAVPAYDVNGDGSVDHTGYRGGGCHLYLVQFWTQPTAELVALIQACGAALHDYQPFCTYLVRMTDKDREALGRLNAVRSVRPYHPIYKLPSHSSAVFLPDGEPGGIEARRFDVLVFDRGLEAQESVGRALEAAGGVVIGYSPSGRLMSAMLTPSQLRIAIWNDAVMWVDEWSLPQAGGTGPDPCEFGPGNPASRLAYPLTGTDAIHTLGFRGQGVIGQVFGESRFAASLLDFQHFGPSQVGPPILQGILCPPPNPIFDWGQSAAANVGGSHGTAAFGTIFGSDPATPEIEGVLPLAEQGLFASAYAGRTCNPGNIRIPLTEQLVDQYDAVFQSCSAVSPGDLNDPYYPFTISYSAVAHDLDDVVFRKDVLVCHLMWQVATGQQLLCLRGGCKDAMAKNVVTVGGVKVRASANRADHCWGCQAVAAGVPGRGPTLDDRVKPDLVNVYDRTSTVSVSCLNWPEDPCGLGSAGCGQGCEPAMDPCYEEQNFDRTCCNFGGTSSATPLTAGMFGLLFQMWRDEVFPGHGSDQQTVFEVRPHAATAKALMINTAFRYPIQNPAPACDTINDFTRENQGWGMPSLKGRTVGGVLENHGLYDVRNNLYIIDQGIYLSSVGQQSPLTVFIDGAMPLRVTLVYMDPAANPGSTITLRNDLNLKVISPTGAIYYGNSGLQTSNWSSTAVVGDNRNTVENVFVQSPAIGYWQVIVTVAALTVDAILATPNEIDVEYALVISGLGPPPNSTRPGDWNADGFVDTSDVFSFVDSFLRGEGDCDGDGQSSVHDFFTFLEFVTADSSAVK